MPTFKELIDNGLLDNVSQITVNVNLVCYSWNIESVDGVNPEITIGEKAVLTLHFDDESPSEFDLDQDVVFDGLDICVKENSQKEKDDITYMSFQRCEYIDAEKFVTAAII